MYKKQRQRYYLASKLKAKEETPPLFPFLLLFLLPIFLDELSRFSMYNVHYMYMCFNPVYIKTVSTVEYSTVQWEVLYSV